MSKKKYAAGLIYGMNSHYIDHLAPLCDILHIPLLVTEEEIKRSLALFYPNVEVLHISYIQIPTFLIQNFDLIFLCTPRALFDEVFALFERLYQKTIDTIWCPHGNSDKGHLVPCMEALNQEKKAIVYGEKMLDFLKQKQAFSNLNKYVKTGNFRLAYYLENKNFYDDLFYQDVASKLPKAKKTVLYAPTWQDLEDSSSFYQALDPLIQNLPPDWNLIIKPHPNLLIEREKSAQLIDSYKEHKNVFFLCDFPPIYPLLSISDYYVGDFSSISYDFLAFNRPMFFLNPQKRNKKEDLGLYVHRCGKSFEPNEYKNIYHAMQEQDNSFIPIQKAVYDYTFGKQIPLHHLKNTLESFFYETSCHSNRS